MGEVVSFKLYCNECNERYPVDKINERFVREIEMTLHVCNYCVEEFDYKQEAIETIFDSLFSGSL